MTDRGRTAIPHPRRRQPGWWYPWTFVGGMLIVVVVNLIMVRAAIDTFPGLETEDHYRKGLAYNANLEAARRQAERGWQMRHDFAADRSAAAEGRSAGTLTVSFADRDGMPLTGLAVTAMLTRPTHGGADFEVPLAELGEGRYGATLSLPFGGQWQARILAKGRDAAFQETWRLFVP